jgi:DNA (cytosine-5)-methyltransferase 1
VPIRYIDLFAGCGGISLGLYQSGLQGLFAVEKNPDAFLTLKHNLIEKRKNFNWPEWLEVKNWNINRLLSTKEGELLKLRGSVDLIVGGPPCQGFSIARKRHATDNRNNLIHSYLKFIELIQPRTIMFENVYGFTLKFSNSRTHKKKAYSEIVLEKLIELGYTDAFGKMINMFEFGIPQRRKRFIVIATREGLAEQIFMELEKGKQDFLKSKGITKNITTRDALSDLEQKNGETQCPDSKNFKSGISSVPVSEIQKYLQLNQPESYVPDSHRFINHKKETISLFQDLLDRAPRNKCIRGKERDIYGVKKRYLTVLDPDQPSPTITTIPDDFIHYSEPRVMTVRECARLQSFPDWFEFKGVYTTGNKIRTKSVPRYTQVGNAVPPFFAEQLGSALVRVLLSNAQTANESTKQNP